MKKLFVVFLLFTMMPLQAKKRSSDWWMGGGIGAVFPSNIGINSQSLGFATVAVPGWKTEFETKWFFAPRLSLAGALSWSQFGQDDAFWDLGSNGTVKNSYAIASALCKGHYYFGDRDLIPYAGIGFGSVWLNNHLKYSSNLSGTLSDNSVEYSNRQFKPMFAPEFGFLATMSKKALFYLTFSYVVIPNMSSEYVSIKDEYGYIVEVVNQNPHGNENHFSLTAGFLFRFK